MAFYKCINCSVLVESKDVLFFRDPTFTRGKMYAFCSLRHFERWLEIKKKEGGSL